MRRTLLALPLVLASCSSPDAAPLEESAQQGAPIIGGVIDDGAGEHNSVVMLYVDGSICTGSLIAPNLVLTARHCVSKNITPGIGCDPDGNSTNGNHVGSDYPASSIGVYLGTYPQPGFGSAPAHGAKLFHPEGQNLCNNDIALLLLDKSFDASYAPMKIRLNFSAQKGELTTAVGYGKTSSSDFSAGQRHRRSKIPVVSVGRDFNYYLGESEFVMGQSTCQGDSGGPVLADDTGAILGVTSRGGDCFSGHQRFIRVDAHKSLILAALAEAGASAQDEGKATPPPADPLSTGKGTCTTGSDCDADFCDTDKMVCSTFCNPGLCPTGLVCQPATIKIEQQAVGNVPICRAYDGVDACDDCRYSKCKLAAETCGIDPDCSKMLACAIKCTTEDCYQGCAAQNAKGAALYKDVRTCECSSKCAKPCAGTCGSEPAGSGGTGGASGGAGGASSGAGGANGGASGGTAEGGQGGAGQIAGSSPGGAPSAGGAGAPTSAGQAGDDQGSAGADGESSGKGQGGGTPSTPSVQPTDDGTSSGGCSTSSPASGQPWWLAVAALGALRRRRR